MEIKKIYSIDEALVTDALINASDDVINEAIPEASAGFIIYTAGYKILKQKSLDDQWVEV